MYIAIDLYDGYSQVISESEFKIRKQGLGKGKKCKATTVWLGEEEMIIRIDAIS